MSIMQLSLNWMEVPFVVFDTETTGKYPLDAEICELAAVKWMKGQEVSRFQTLIRPSCRMNEEVIAIHHITNEMVEKAPSLSDKIKEFYDFISGSVLVGHHVPFDLGFLAPEFEKARLLLPPHPVLCTSLLSRAVIPESPNHRLSTLVNLLKLKGGQAHRAMDDTLACAGLFQCIVERMGRDVSLAALIARQGVDLRWRDYSIQNLKADRVWGEVVRALENRHSLEIVYKGGSKPGRARTIWPVGLVRNYQGDFLVAREKQEGLSQEFEEQAKRYFLNKITAARL